MLQAVANTTAPIVFVHSLEDTLVDAHHSRELYSRAKSTSTLIEISGSHNDMRPVGVLKQVVDSLETSLTALDETTTVSVTMPVKVKSRVCKEKQSHYRDRTRAQCGSYSEQAFRMALQELVNR